MALTLGMTGMERHTEAEVTAAFKAANVEIGGHWTLVDSEHADYVIIDMDSLYGPMSWLRLHGLGRKVIGLTSTDRQQTDYRLPHPISASDLAVLLSEIETDAPLLADAAAAKHPPTASTPAGIAPAEVPAEPLAAIAGIEATDIIEAPATATTPEPVAEPQATAPAPPAASVQPQAKQPLLGWLAGGRPTLRVRLQHAEAPPLLLDIPRGHWYGPAALKPLAPHFATPLEETDFIALDEAAWAEESARLGAAQPLARLLWLGGLLSSAPVTGPYVLKKWPQTEREYPRHFRIATVMMKGPADADAIAAAAGVPQAEVVDFINANLATGYAEPAPTAPPPEPAATKPAGLFGRLRGH
ncbi:MAG: hypothetical protein J0H95_01355 [Xanthomonadales bacterium]|nr:hypothetical protein [Xanthomonadales bacterium]MBN8794502.1 hypothetical protein [Stenotrophomonas nitritireducens]